MDVVTETVGDFGVQMSNINGENDPDRKVSTTLDVGQNARKTPQIAIFHALTKCCKGIHDGHDGM